MNNQTEIKIKEVVAIVKFYDKCVKAGNSARCLGEPKDVFNYQINLLNLIQEHVKPGYFRDLYSQVVTDALTLSHNIIFNRNVDETQIQVRLANQLREFGRISQEVLKSKID